MSEILKNRYDVIALVDATMCNPNGDPDMNNLPRTDFTTGRGIITDVAVKARIRGYVDSCEGTRNGYNILMKPSASINRAIAEAALTVNEVDVMKGDNTRVDDTKAYMCHKYWDVRTFGGVLATGMNAGQVIGAVQIGMSLSVDPVEPTSVSITRRCYAELKKYNTLAEYDDADAKTPEDKKRTIGKKTFVPYGLYPVYSSVSANLAQKVGFTDDDLKIFLEGLMQMYNYEPTSSKTGMSVLSPVIVFKHVGHDTSDDMQRSRECLLGCAAMHKLHNLLEIKKKDDVVAPRSISDYTITLRLSKLPDGVICGIKRAAFDEIEWLSGNDDIEFTDM